MRGVKMIIECYKVKNLLSAYVDRELDPITEAAVKNHLTECDRCYGEYLSFLSVKTAVGNVKEAVPSEDFCLKLQELFEDDRALAEELKNIKCICRRRRFGGFSVFGKHSNAFIAAAAVAVMALCTGLISAGIGSRSVSPGGPVFSENLAGGELLPAMALQMADAVYDSGPGGENKYRMRERALMQSSGGIPSDSYKLFCAAYRSR